MSIRRTIRARLIVLTSAILDIANIFSTFMALVRDWFILLCFCVIQYCVAMIGSVYFVTNMVSQNNNFLKGFFDLFALQYLIRVVAVLF